MARYEAHVQLRSGRKIVSWTFDESYKTADAVIQHYFQENFTPKAVLIFPGGWAIKWEDIESIQVRAQGYLT